MKIIIAIDHKDSSICKYLGRTISSKDIHNIRQIIINYFISQNIDKIVVSIPDSLIINKSYKIKDFTITGFPDLLVYNNFDNKFIDLLDLPFHYQFSSILKVGFNVSKDIDAAKKVCSGIAGNPSIDQVMSWQ